MSTLRTVLLLSATLTACVTITEEDPRRSRGIHVPEPVPVSAWQARETARADLPVPTEWIAPRSDGAQAGLVVFVEGEGSGPEAEPLIERLAERGFRILRVRIDALVAPRLERVVQRPEEIDEVAGELARAVDAGLVRVARAVARELKRIDELEPTAPLRPIVLVGVGLGACAAPAVAARLAGRVDAAVLVGGGASLFEVVAAESLETDGVDLDLQVLTAPQRAFFADVYLSESRLDPFHTVRFLVGKPVLLAHARFDEVVPHWTGDVLHARLGSPKRLRVLGDHEDLLDELEVRADWIDAWIAGAVRG